MTHIYIGCDKIIGGRANYFKKLSALEVSGTFEDKLTDKRLGQWRTDSPKGFAFAMSSHRGVTHPAETTEQVPSLLQDHPPHSIGLLQDTKAVHEAWDRTLEQAQLLSPKVIVLRTPIEFSPSDDHRASLTHFARHLVPKAGKMAVAWEPHGLWDPQEYVPLARELGLVPVFDPFIKLDTKQGRGTACFSLHTRRGLRTTFDDFDMEDLLDLCEPYQRAIVIFRGPRRFRDARLAQTILDARKSLGV